MFLMLLSIDVLVIDVDALCRVITSHYVKRCQALCKPDEIKDCFKMLGYINENNCILLKLIYVR